MHPTMVSEMLELIHRYRIKPDTLILEVTESRRIDDPNEAVAILKPLRNAGIRIALDDFGMGYAGLRQLQHMKTLPVDVLKIDKAFVDGLPEDSSMVQAIIQMARSLNLHLIAEGLKPKRSALAGRGGRGERTGLPVCPLFLRMSLKNATFPVLTITQKCNFVAGLCESAQSS
jgi:sensor c-di-GMP phosphodiesterase-like protein